MRQTAARPRFALLLALLALSVAACLSNGTGSGPTPAGGASSGPAAASDGGAGSAAPSHGSGAGSSADPSAAQSAGPSDAAASAAASPKPIASVKGTGFVDSASFKLPAGSYVVRWSVTSKDAAGCNVVGAVHTPDGRTSVDILSTKVSGATTKTGQKATGKLKAGTYIVTMATTCSWRADIYAQ